MPLDFSPLQTIDPAGAFYRGQEAARAEQDRNMMRRFQMEQGLAQRENIYAQRQERQALAAQRQRELEQANKLQAYMESGMPQGEEALLQYGRAGTQAAEELRKMRGGQIEQEKRLLDFVTPRLAAATEQTYPFIRSDIARISPKFAEGLPLNYDEATIKAIARQGMAIKDQLEAGKPQVVGPGQRLVSPAGKEIFAAPLAPEKEKPYEPTELEKLLNRQSQVPPGSPEARALENRIRILTTREPKEPREPAAPTITQIQDPTNSMQMITIDARRYAGGGVGSPGVIGASGKTVKAEAETLKKEQAQSDAAAILDTLKVAYTNLDRMRAIPSEQRGALSNIASGLAATGVGQMAGRMTGTEAQTQRDIIASARNQLFAAVKNATGLSAQNLNSNVEFTTWLNSLTDPSRSIQSNQAILENMERFIASGGKYSTRKSEGKVTSTPAAGAAGAGRYQSLSNEELLRQLGVKPGRP